MAGLTSVNVSELLNVEAANPPNGLRGDEGKLSKLGFGDLGLVLLGLVVSEVGALHDSCATWLALSNCWHVHIKVTLSGVVTPSFRNNSLRS